VITANGVEIPEVFGNVVSNNIKPNIVANTKIKLLGNIRYVYWDSSNSDYGFSNNIVINGGQSVTFKYDYPTSEGGTDTVNTKISTKDGSIIYADENWLYGGDFPNDASTNTKIYYNNGAFAGSTKIKINLNMTNSSSESSSNSDITPIITLSTNNSGIVISNITSPLTFKKDIGGTISYSNGKFNGHVYCRFYSANPYREDAVGEIYFVMRTNNNKLSVYLEVFYRQYPESVYKRKQIVFRSNEIELREENE
jgi:hypothetical protein